MTTDPAPPPGQEQLLSPLSSRLRRFLVDPGSRRFGPGGRVMLAGSPRRLFRLSEAGAAIVDRIGTGRALVDSPARSELVDRLLDAGVLHPYPTAAEGAASVADVTLVVPVRDRAGGLESLLESVLVADDTPVAIVVVDDGSTDPDAVRAVVTAAATADGVAVELVRNEQPRGPAAARNTGLRRVATSLVAMVDSDCRVERGWLAPLLTQFADPRVALVAPRVRSREMSRVGLGGVLASYETLRSPLDLGRHRSRVAPSTVVPYVPSAAVVARAGVLAELGGFDEQMSTGEDVDLVWRLVDDGHRVRYEPSSAVHHDPRTALRGWLAQRVGYGRSAAALNRRHPGSVAPIVIGRSSAAVWGVFVAGGPAPAAAVVAVTTVGVVRSIPDLPARAAAGVALSGHLAAGRQLARTAVREWWPIAVGLSVFSRHARRLLAVAVGVSVVQAWRSGVDRDRPEISPPAFAALAILDDAAYGVGVWIGCIEQRSFRALLPRR